MNGDNTFFLIGRIKEYATGYLERELKASGMKKIVSSHADIIAVLKIFGEQTMTEISEKINRDRSTVTALVTKLEKQGFVRQRKNESDQRYSFCSITDKGKKLIPEILSISDKLYKKAVAGISEKEWERFRRVLEKLYNNLV